jgi:uncharacterized repeat protein (TIGR01451 family)
MDTRQNTPRVFRAAAVAMVGLVMVCGLLILFGGMAEPATAAPLWANVNSDITVDTTWYYTDSPYIILTNTVSVLNGAVLTIEPGVEVQFQDGAQLQFPNGQLNAIGTLTRPITFTAQITPARGSWEGIIFGTNAQTSTIQYATIEYARSAIQINTGQVPFYVYSSTIRYVGDDDGDPTTGGAIVGEPDASQFSYNRVYSSEVGIYLGKAGSNWIQDNQIYDIDGYCIGLIPSLGTNSSNNHIVNNQIYDCRNDGIRLIGLGSLAKASGNILSDNVISNTNGEAIYAVNQTQLEITDNLIHDTALTTTLGTGGTGSNQAAVALIGVDNPDLSGNQVYDNGGSGGNYEGAVFIEDTDSLVLRVEDNVIRDSQASGIVYAGVNTATVESVYSNAICVEPRYEIENRDGALTADGNWLGTNFPTLGTEYTGTVTVSPTILLDISPADASIIADGMTTTTLNITFNDGAGHVVPSSARDIAVATSAGTLSTNMVTVDSTGQASLILTSTSIPGTAIVTATDSCGYAVTDTVTFAGYVDLSVIKTASPPPYAPGSLITYTISYRNDGNTPASGVVLTETIPTSTTLVGPPGWTQVGSTNQYTWFVGSLSPLSGTLTATLVVSIDTSLPAGDASFTNVVQIGDDGAAGADYDPADNVFTLTVSGGNLPDLWVVKNDNVGPGSMSGAMVGALANTEGGPGILQLIHTMDSFSTQAVPEGGLITYTIGYGNSSQGTAPATGVVLSETLPLYTTYAGPACGQPGGWCQVDATRTYTRFVGGPLFPVTGDYTYFQVQVDSSLPSSVTQVINTVCIYGNEDDLIPSNNCSTEETDVITGTYDLSVTKVENTICPNPGDALNYQITVRNQGANDATNVTLQEIVPDNTAFIGPTGWTAVGGGIYTYDLGIVPSGAISSALFSVQIDPNLAPSVEVITNVVSVQADGSDSDPTNNSYTLITPVGTTPDLAITKNDNILDEVDPGGVISYTVIYLNNSHRFTATNVVVTDTLPLGTVITGTSASLWNQVGSSNVYTYIPSSGDLIPNEVGSVPLVVQLTDPVSYPYGSEVVNHVEIGGAEAECNITNNVASEETPVRGANATDLEVSKVDNVPFCAVPGDAIEYTITYTNNSFTIDAQNVVLTEMIDEAAVTFLGPSGWTGGAGTYTRNVTTTLAARESGVVDFDVQISYDIPPGQEYITNVVHIDTSTSDWNLANNVYTLTTYVPEWPDLIVVKNDNVGSLGTSALAEINALTSRLQFSREALALLQSSLTRGQIGAMAESVNPGDTITYTIILGNIGRVPATGVVLTETLPAGTTFVGPGYWHHAGGNQYTYALSSPLDDDYGDVLQFIVQVDDPFLAGDRVINIVQIGGTEPECNTANNFSSDETPVAGAGFSNSVYLPLILKNYPQVPPTPIPTPTRPPIPTPTPPPVPVPGEDSHVADLVVDPQSHYVYVASPRDDKVHFIHVSDVNTYTHEYYNDIVVGNGPTGLGDFPIGGLNSRIFVAHAFDWSGGLRYFYPNPASLVGPDNGYVGAAPFKVAVNPALSRAYVSNYWDYLAVVDAADNTRLGWVGQKNYQGGWGIDVSTDTNRIYLASRDTGELVAFDGNGDRLLQFGYIPTHFKPPEPCSLYTVAVNESTDHIFVPCPALRKVFVHEEFELEIFATQELGTLELREDGWVRVLAPGDVNWLESISLNSGIVSQYGGVWGIAVDETTDRVYITDPGNDALVVIQDASSRDDMTVSYVTKADGLFDEPQGVDVDSERGRVFVANAGNDTVTVLEATAPFTLVTTIDLGGP